MNEIAIIEFESFQENIALDDTALNSKTGGEKREGELQLKRKTFPLLKHGKHNCLSQIVMSNEENHIILDTLKLNFCENVCGVVELDSIKATFSLPTCGMFKSEIQMCFS
jgi:hypothetical protein